MGGGGGGGGGGRGKGGVTTVHRPHFEKPIVSNTS